LTCPTKGSLSATLVLSGRLTRPATNALGAALDVDDTEFGAMTSNSAIAPYFRNGSTAFTSGNVVVSDLGALATGGTSRQTFKVSLPATVAVGDVITFAGWTEGVAVGTYVPNRSIASSSCTYANDVTPPTVTIRAVMGSTTEAAATTSAGARIIVEADENISFTSTTHAGLVKIAGQTVTTSVTQVINASAPGSTNRYILMVPSTSALPPGTTTSDAIALGTVIELNKSGIIDKNGNSPVTDPRTVAGPDLAPASITLGGIGTTASAQVKLASGNLQFTAAKAGAYDGHVGSAWKLVVNNQRGLIMPTVTVDAENKQIVVLADDGYHTVADIATAYAQSGDEDWSVGHKTSGGALTDKVSRTLVPATCSIAAATCGESHVTLQLNSSEPITVEQDGTNNGLSLTVNGLSTGWVSSPLVASAEVPFVAGGTLTGKSWGYGKVITFTSKTAGAGTVSFVDSFNAPTDTAGNKSSTPVSFTL
jgi:hypothetical protein